MVMSRLGLSLLSCGWVVLLVILSLGGVHGSHLYKN